MKGRTLSGRSFDAEYAAAIGARLRRLRETRGLSLSQACRLAMAELRWDLKPVSLASWERGDRRVPVHKLAALARLYGVPVADLLPGTQWDAPEPPSVLSEFPAEISLTMDSLGRWALVLDGPQLHGAAVSTSRPVLLAIAESYAAMRRDQEAVSAA
jgi:transcriptional regulator with XRE-family HTH domain